MKAVFLDRDGVINENRSDHVKSWDEFRFLPGALWAIARLGQAGVGVFVVTNQSIINRGIVPRSVVDRVNESMIREIERHGGRISGLACCPHRADERCECRKPRPGLLFELARKHRIDLGSSVVIGDALSDVGAAQAAGCQAILVLTGRGRAEYLTLPPSAQRFLVLPDLVAAADFVLAGHQVPSGPVTARWC